MLLKPPALRTNQRQGVVLLVVIAMLALGAYSFTNLMLAHHEAAIVTGRHAQARSLVDSGVTATQLFLAEPQADRLEAGGIYDNAERFRGIVVMQDDDPLQRGGHQVGVVRGDDLVALDGGLDELRALRRGRERDPERYVMHPSRREARVAVGHVERRHEL